MKAAHRRISNDGALWFRRKISHVEEPEEMSVVAPFFMGRLAFHG